MIIYRRWQKRLRGGRRLYCEGWFLLGIIPLYIRYLEYDLPVKS